MALLAGDVHSLAAVSEAFLVDLVPQLGRKFHEWEDLVLGERFRWPLLFLLDGNDLDFRLAGDFLGFGFDIVDLALENRFS